jgi:hypothetical protein
MSRMDLCDAILYSKRHAKLKALYFPYLLAPLS